MTDLTASKRALSRSEKKSYYKKDFWGEENLKFSRPWYRLEKVARIVASIAGSRECDLLDVGCGPAALMQVLPPTVHYYGIDIAIQEPAGNLREADLVESPIEFDGRTFDIVVAQGLFEYLGDVQGEKFAEIARVLRPGGTFVTSYTNFDHRKTEIYWPFSNVQPIPEFRANLSDHFTIDSMFPSSHNWKHSQPSRPLVKAVNMHVNTNIPLVSPRLAVEYLFICSPLPS